MRYLLCVAVVGDPPDRPTAAKGGRIYMGAVEMGPSLRSPPLPPLPPCSLCGRSPATHSLPKEGEEEEDDGAFIHSFRESKRVGAAFSSSSSVDGKGPRVG